MKINTIIFDMDGLMFDTEHFYVDLFMKNQKKENFKFPKEYILDMLGTNTRKDYYAKLYPGLLNFMKIVNEKFMPEFFQKFPYPGQANKSGLKELHDYLKKNGYQIAIASSSSLEHIHKLVNYCGFDFKADLILSANGHYPSKPAPDVFLACAKKLNVNPENCLVLEDSRHGIRAAYNAGMHRVWIPDQVIFTDEDMKYVEYQKGNLLGVIDLLEAI